METNNQINIADLRKIINKILDFIEKDLGKNTVDLKHNFYWSIADDALYLMEREPAELDCGSLADDREFVLGALKRSSQPLPMDFIHVAPLLHAIAHAVPSYVPPKTH